MRDRDELVGNYRYKLNGLRYRCYTRPRNEQYPAAGAVHERRKHKEKFFVDVVRIPSIWVFIISARYNASIINCERLARMRIFGAASQAHNMDGMASMFRHGNG